MPSKSSSDHPTPKHSEIGFDDIIGHKKVKKRLRTIIELLHNPELLHNFSISMPKGLLLYGPESVGKSMLARAFAKEATLPYFEISGSSLFDLDHIKAIYREALEHAPSMVILQDIHIKGVLQGMLTHISFSDIAKIIEELPVDEKRYIFTFATALDLQEIDPVLTAPGKLDFVIEVSKLDREARMFFLKKILQKPHEKKIDIERVSRYITGLGADDLERLGRMAALNAIEQGKKRISEEILIEQINIIKYGHKIESKMVRNLEKELKMTAYHEAGHAVLSYLLLPNIKIEQVTIAPRSQTLGFVSYNAEEQIQSVSKEEIFNDICVLLAGRLSKIKKFPKEGMDTGAAEDLSEATFQAYTAITNLGMDKELGFVNIDSIVSVDSTFLQKRIEERLLHWIETAKKRAERLIADHWDQIEKLAQLLMEKEIVEAEELEKLLKGVRVTRFIPSTI